MADRPAGEVFGIQVNELIAFGVVLLVAAVLARGGRGLGLPTVPFFMAAGILLGPALPNVELFRDPAALQLLASFGLVLLLFHVGVEFPLEQVRAAGGRLLLAAGTFIGLNLAGGLTLGLVLGWGVPEALVIAGVMSVSSSAIVTKLLIEQRRLANAETSLILGIIVVEDLFVALYLSLIGPVLGGAENARQLLVDIGVSFAFLAGLILVARFGARAVAAVVDSREDELLTVGIFGLLLLVAGVALDIGLSDAIGALLLGLVVSRTALRERVERIVLPLRDGFAVLFFVAFGFGLDPGGLAGVVVPVLVAVAVSLVLDTTAGILTARMYRLNQRAATNMGLTLASRGEFSLILGALAVGAGLDPRIASFVALYVLILAVLSPVATANARRIAGRIPDALLRGDFRFVRAETTGTTCGHLDEIRTTTPSTPDGCPECLALGDGWVHLRLCTTCGKVACCDDSKNRHATAHYRAEGHPIIESFEPAERWRWCYVDEILVTGGPPARIDGGIPEDPRPGQSAAARS
jgi:CPA2 family monovalent cation:H+ antiporter-2